MSKSESVKEEGKRTSDGSKPEAPATLERISGGIAYVRLRDHEARCKLLENHDRVLARIRQEYPNEQVDKISAYIGRPKLNGTGRQA